jgi:acyl carrier protein
VRRIVRVSRAEGVGGHEPPALFLAFTEAAPARREGETWEQHLRSAWQAQAQQVVDALYASAPGGLVDAIFGCLAVRRASLYVVPHVTPGPPAKEEEKPMVITAEQREALALQVVREVLAPTDETPVLLDSDLRKELGADSLDLVELGLRLEELAVERHHLMLDLNGAEDRWTTVRDLATALEQA